MASQSWAGSDAARLASAASPGNHSWSTANDGTLTRSPRHWNQAYEPQPRLCQPTCNAHPSRARTSHPSLQPLGRRASEAVGRQLPKHAIGSRKGERPTRNDTQISFFIWTLHELHSRMKPTKLQVADCRRAVHL